MSLLHLDDGAQTRIETTDRMRLAKYTVDLVG
jgi:hypothetical protein